VRLFEHPDFEQAVLHAAQHSGVSEQFVEKDYYVTEILRIIAVELDDKAMFKGGTSLSKGWGLISRFSEDIEVARAMFTGERLTAVLAGIAQIEPTAV